MGRFGCRKCTVEMAQGIWDLHDKGKKAIAIAATYDCSEITVKRMINIYETARKSPEKLKELYPGSYFEIKRTAKEIFAAQPKSEDFDNTLTFLVAVLKQLNEANGYLHRICKALDIK